MGTTVVLMGLLADAALLAALALVPLLLVAFALGRCRTVSSHLRYAVLLKALLAGPVLLAGFAVVRPGPVGCVTASCGVSWPTASSAGLHYSLEAAAKFREEAPPAVDVPRPLGAPAVPLVAGWGLGIVLLLTRCVRRRRGLGRLIDGAVVVERGECLGDAERLGRRLGLRRLPRLLSHPGVDHAVVGGALRPAVFLPADVERMPTSERRMVLLHELAHVRRRDPAASLAVELVTSVFWFHPLVWAVGPRISRLQEMATDSCVVERGVRPSEYADYLLSTWRRLSRRRALTTPLHSITGDCMITDRIHALLDPRTRHGTPGRSLRAGVTFVFAALLAAALYGSALVGPASAAQSASAGPDTRLLTHAALDSVLRPVVINLMTDRYVAGAAISVVHEGRVVYAAGFGDREVYSEDPVDPARTIFRIGSITKVLTGLAVMQLVDRGLVDLDADVNEYLSDVRVPAAFAAPVRVRHLLTHTAGFDQIGLDRHAGSAGEVEPLGEWLSGRLVRVRPPGEVSAYDTYAITLAGHLVEAVSGLSYEEYLRRYVFEPLGMHRSGILVPPALADDVAVGYGFAGEWEALPWEYMNTAPASTVNATVLDMAKLAAMFLGEGSAGGARVLGEASARAMLTRQFTNHPDQPGYGLTFFEGDWNGIETFGHGGSMTGYSALLTLVPEHELGVFIACNQESGALMPVLDVLLGALFPDARPAPLRDRYRGRLDLSRFVGTYANNVYNHANPEVGWIRRPVEVELGGGDESGAIVFEGAPAWPVAPHTFQRPDGLLISFLEDDAGGVSHMVVGQAVYERLD